MQRMHTSHFDFSIRVLLYPEEDGIVAHALEMDLVGCGADERTALRTLQEMIEAQLSFASTQNDRPMIFHQAPPQIFERWEKAHAAHLRTEISAERCARKVNLKARVICFTAEDLHEAMRSRRFQPLTESAFAEA